MTKNITVTDENGNILGSTYPKRASGLVKKDRARWINADTICLCAREDMEEKTMANNFYEVFDNQITKIQEHISDYPPEKSMQVQMQILKTMETFRAQEQGTKILDMISSQLDFIKEDLAKTADFKFANMPAGGIALRAREETKQKMLSIMETMINATMIQSNSGIDFKDKSAVDESCSKCSTENPDETNSAEKFSTENSDKVNEAINSAFNKTK